MLKVSCHGDNLGILGFSPIDGTLKAGLLLIFVLCDRFTGGELLSSLSTSLVCILRVNLRPYCAFSFFLDWEDAIKSSISGLDSEFTFSGSFHDLLGPLRPAVSDLKELSDDNSILSFDSAVRRLLFLAALESRQYYVALAANRRAGGVDATDVETAAGMAEAHRQIGQPAEAVPLFGLAASLEKDTGRRQALEERQKQAQAASDRLLENERRRPVMRADVDQPNAVRRRLP